MASVSKATTANILPLTATMRLLNSTTLDAAAFAFSFFNPNSSKFHFSPQNSATFTKLVNKLAVRNSSSITAKPSSEFRKKRSDDKEPDKKMQAFRELFATPTINIDAYIIPSNSLTEGSSVTAENHQLIFNACGTTLNVLKSRHEPDQIFVHSVNEVEVKPKPKLLPNTAA